MTEIKHVIWTLPLCLLLSNARLTNYFLHSYSGKRHNITLSSQAELGTENIHTLFLNKFFTGNYLDEALKNSVRDRLANYNRLGADWISELRYVNMNDTMLGKNWGYLASFKNRLYAEGRFNRYAFELPFYGNAPYAGMDLPLSGSNGYMMMYQQFQIGFVKTWYQPKSQHVFSFGLGYINGNQLYEARIDSGIVHTALDAESIFLKLDGYLYRNDPSHNRFFNNNGSGLSLDFQYQFSQGNHLLSVQALDIGFINWERAGEYYRVDSTLLYEGVTIDNIITTDGSEFTQYFDSLSQNYIRKETDNPGFRMLPAMLHISYAYRFMDGRIVLQTGVDAKYSIHYFPSMYVRGVFYPHQRVMLAGSLGYGGFGTLNIGLDFGINFGKGYNLTLHTRNLEGLIPNTFATGLSAGFKLSRYF